MSFLEFFVVAIVALLVIGPDKLPGAIRSGAIWIGRIKHLIQQTKNDFEQQVGIDEIRREIHNEEILQSLKKLKVTKDHIQQHIRDADEHMTVNKTEKADDPEEPSTLEHTNNTEATHLSGHANTQKDNDSPTANIVESAHDTSTSANSSPKTGS